MDFSTIGAITAVAFIMCLLGLMLVILYFRRPHMVSGVAGSTTIATAPTVAATTAAPATGSGRKFQWHNAAMLAVILIAVAYITYTAGPMLRESGAVEKITTSIEPAVLAIFLLLLVSFVIGVIRWKDSKKVAIWSLALLILLIALEPASVITAARNKFQDVVSSKAATDEIPGTRITAPANEWSEEITISPIQCVVWQPIAPATEASFHVQVYDWKNVGWIFLPDYIKRKGETGVGGISQVRVMSSGHGSVELIYVVGFQGSPICDGVTK